MRQVKAIIVDDEVSAVATLRGMLDDFCPMIDVIHVANTIDHGVKAAEQYKPDVVFLDIEMPPHGNGFDFLRRTEHLPFGVIFTTAYAEYAVRAINEVQPWAYLIKPYKTTELIKAAHAAQAKVNENGFSAKHEHRGFVIKDMKKGSIVVRYTELMYCQADSSCTLFYIRRNGQLERIAIYKSLKDLEAELPDTLFCRVHHSFLVNLSYIQRYERLGRTGKLYLENGINVDVSAQKMDHFLRQFNRFLQGPEIG